MKRIELTVVFNCKKVESGYYYTGVIYAVENGSMQAIRFPEIICDNYTQFVENCENMSLNYFSDKDIYFDTYTHNLLLTL